MEKAWFHEKLFSEVVMVMVKDKKIHHKRCNFNQNKFYALHEVDKRNVTNGFQRIGSGLYFFAPFSFLLSLSNKIVIFSKNLGGCSPPALPPPTGFYGPVKHFPFSRYSNSEKNLEKKGEVSLKIYGVGTGQQTISIDILPNIS